LSKSLLYRVSRRPTNFIGLVVSVITGRASDGAAIISEDRERWYHFRHGVGFVSDNLDKVKNSGLYDMTYIREATERDVSYFESMLGIQWSWKLNCFILTSPLWWTKADAHMDQPMHKSNVFDTAQTIGMSGAFVTVVDWVVNVLSPMLHGAIAILTFVSLLPSAWKGLKWLLEIFGVKFKSKTYPKMSDFTEPLE